MTYGSPLASIKNEKPIMTTPWHTLAVCVPDDRADALRATHIADEWRIARPGATVYHLSSGLVFRVTVNWRKRSGKAPRLSQFVARLSPKCDGGGNDTPTIVRI